VKGEFVGGCDIIRENVPRAGETADPDEGEGPLAVVEKRTQA